MLVLMQIMNLLLKHYSPNDITVFFQNVERGVVSHDEALNQIGVELTPFQRKMYEEKFKMWPSALAVSAMRLGH